MDVKPFVKWVGGKRQLMKTILEFAPRHYESYIEPFLGGGSVFFALEPQRAIVGDVNKELINVYRIIQREVDALIDDLKKHKNESDYYYATRALDLEALTPVERASRFIYLNKTCYNGLYRENSKGGFNAAFGRYEKPCILDEPNLRAVHDFLTSREVEINCWEFGATTSEARDGDFIYFDPPYYPMSKTADFTRYSKSKFQATDQEKLADEYRRLDALGCKVMLSNSNTDFIKELYAGYEIVEVGACRRINIDPTKRGVQKNEVLIRNYT